MYTPLDHWGSTAHLHLRRQIWLRTNGGRRHRRATNRLEVRVADTAHVPQLAHKAAALVMHRLHTYGNSCHVQF